jgi:hypothetical protein
MASFLHARVRARFMHRIHLEALTLSLPAPQPSPYTAKGEGRLAEEDAPEARRYVDNSAPLQGSQAPVLRTVSGPAPAMVDRGIRPLFAVLAPCTLRYHYDPPIRFDNASAEIRPSDPMHLDGDRDRRGSNPRGFPRPAGYPPPTEDPFEQLLHRGELFHSCPAPIH